MSERKNDLAIFVIGCAVVAYLFYKDKRPPMLELSNGSIADMSLSENYQRSIYDKTLSNDMSSKEDTINSGVQKNENPENKPPNKNKNPVQSDIDIVEKTLPKSEPFDDSRNGKLRNIPYYITGPK